MFKNIKRAFSVYKSLGTVNLAITITPFLRRFLQRIRRNCCFSFLNPLYSVRKFSAIIKKVYRYISIDIPELIKCHLIEVTIFVKKLCGQYRAACRSAQGVVREAYELIVENIVLPESARGHAHTAVNIAIQRGLGTVRLVDVGDKLLGRMRKVKLLRFSFKFRPCFEDFLLRRLFLEAYRNRSKMSVADGDADALRRNGGRSNGNNLSVLNAAPDFKRFLSRSFLLAAG
jgi:hypothetical protein